MRIVSIIVVVFSLVADTLAQEDIQPNADSLLKTLRLHLRQFAEAESNSFEYFESLFHIRSAYFDFPSGSDFDAASSALLQEELSETNLDTLYDFFDRAHLWTRQPADAELKSMAESEALIETPSEYGISHSEKIRTSIRSTENIYLYEGYIRGKGSRDFDFESFAHDDQEFILPKRLVEDENKTLLRELVGTNEFFVDWRGAKACGGFSADYMVEWKLDGDSVRVMICTGCYEIIIKYRDQWFKHDFGREKSSEIKKGLAQLDVKREEMRKIIAAESAPKVGPGFTEEEKAEIRAALKGEN